MRRSLAVEGWQMAAFKKPVPDQSTYPHPEEVQMLGYPSSSFSANCIPANRLSHDVRRRKSPDSARPSHEPIGTGEAQHLLRSLRNSDTGLVALINKRSGARVHVTEKSWHSVS
jgi:hypothetical protein